MTPTHNSTYTSELLPAWFGALAPGEPVIAASHTGKLALRFSGRVQRYVRAFGDVLGYGLASEARERWENKHGAEYLAAGVGGAIPGYRAGLAIIDDPYPGRREADSETYREGVWAWWHGDLQPRLKPKAGVILMHTRYHEADLAGRLLEIEGHEWTVLKLPAIAESNDDPLGRAIGEPLWADQPGYPFGALMLRKKMELSRSGNMREWTSQYQQSPAPDSGDYFRREWLRAVASVPPRDSLKVYGASDYAVTSDGGDYTVHIVVGLDSDGRLWLLDLWRGQTASDVWVAAFCDMVRQWKPLGWAEERGQIKAGVGPFLLRTMHERRAYVARYDFPTRGDKAVRAQSVRGRMAVEGLYYLAGAEFRVDFESELMTFPVGKHDDQVDALGLIGQLLDKMIQPAAPEPPVDPRGLEQMTMAEAFRLANPRTARGARRI